MPKKNKTESRAPKVVPPVSGDRSSSSVPVSAQESLEWALAAERANKVFDAALARMRSKGQEALLVEVEGATRIQWRKYFSEKGVVFGDDGRALPLPVERYAQKWEHTAQGANMKAQSFFHSLVEPTGELARHARNAFAAVGLKVGFRVSNDLGDPSQRYVPIIVELDLKEMEFLPLGDLEEAIWWQHHKVWARREASRATEAARAELKRCEAAELAIR